MHTPYITPFKMQHIELQEHWQIIFTCTLFGAVWGQKRNFLNFVGELAELMEENI